MRKRALLRRYRKGRFHHLGINGVIAFKLIYFTTYIMRQKIQIEPYSPQCLDNIVRLSLRAWAPVFDSIRITMNTDVSEAFYPNHWHVSQQKAVGAVCI